MPKIRKLSKRVSTKTRVKVEKKVKEHKKKLRREAKKNPKKVKGKDPGIPNNLPFREQVLKEVQIAKDRKQQEMDKKKAARKKAREKIQNQKRNIGEIVNDAKARQAVYDKKHDLDKFQEEYTRSLNKMTENSRKAYFKEFKKVVDAADVVLEVLDARDPIGNRCIEVEDLVRTSSGNKRLVLVLNKIDLVPKENVEAWLKHFRQELPAIAFKASTQQQKGHLTQSKVDVALASKDLLKSSNCLGADVLMKLLGNYCRNSDMSINVGVVGFPNTGKSSIINSLKRSRACNVGAAPGITKAMQTVQLDKHVKLLDSPGVVMSNSPSDTAAVLRNVVKLESLDDPVPCVEAILSRCQKIQMMLHYGIPNYEDTKEFLIVLAKRLGHLKKGGVPDVKRAARTMLQDWNSGKITYYTAPPENKSKSHHIEASIVTEWGKEFNIDDLVEEEKKMLEDLKSKTQQDMCISPLGPLNGLTQDEDMDADDKAEKEIHDEELDEEDDDFEDMEESDDPKAELKGVTVAVGKNAKKNGVGANTKAVPDTSHRHKAPKKLMYERVGGLITKKSRKLAEKREKKKKKRADALAGKLSDSLTAAFSSAGKGEAYSFKDAFDK